jgi:hypothetical protein
MAEKSVKSTEDVVAFLKEQPGRIKELFTETINAPDNDRQEKAFFELRSLLAVHETAEEMVVHRRARSEIEGGDEVIDARLEEENTPRSSFRSSNAWTSARRSLWTRSLSWNVT